MLQTTADVEQAADTLASMTQEIRDLDDQMEMETLETMLEESQRGNGTAETSPGRGEAEAETAESTSADAEPTPGKRSGGIAAALEALDNTNPELSEAVRAQIRDNNALREKIGGIEGRIDQAVQEAVNEALRSQEEPEPEDGQYTPEQIEQAKQRLRSIGAVFKEDLDAEKQQTSRSDYLSTAKKEALERFGESFGTEGEDGSVQISEGAQQGMLQELQRIKQHGTVTGKDLYILHNFDNLIQQAEARGMAKGKAERDNLSEDRGRAGTSSSTTASTPVPNVRGETGTKSDSRQAVMQRSFLAAKKKLGL